MGALAKEGILKANRHTDVTEADPAAHLSAAYESWRRSGFAGICPLRSILDRIGDTWTVLVILHLGAGPVRFRALQRAIDGISQRMLTVTLRAMQRDGFVHRQVLDTSPPSVEYSLTPLGRSLAVPISGLAKWAMENDTAIATARKRNDEVQARG